MAKELTFPEVQELAGTRELASHGRVGRVMTIGKTGTIVGTYAKAFGKPVPPSGFTKKVLTYGGLAFDRDALPQENVNAMLELFLQRSVLEEWKEHYYVLPQRLFEAVGLRDVLPWPDTVATPQQETALAVFTEVTRTYQEMVAQQSEQFRKVQARAAQLQAQLVEAERLLANRDFATQSQVAVEVEPPLEDVRAELDDPQWDFRTVKGLAFALGVTAGQVERVLDSNPKIVRWVPATADDGQMLLVSATRPISRRERLIRIKAALTKAVV